MAVPAPFAYDTNIWLNLNSRNVEEIILFETNVIKQCMR